MKIKYDLHIHSGLSPCAEKDMTPVTIVGTGKLLGLDMMAVSDHNAIANVEVAVRAGEFYGVTVVPAMELQTAEEIHLLCLFQAVSDLKRFYAAIEFSSLNNRPEIFGNQYIYDEDDNIIGEEKSLLLVNSGVPTHRAQALAESFGGVAVPAHIDRDANSMLAILGDITSEFGAVEFSPRADAQIRERYGKGRTVIVDSDAHTLEQIHSGSEIELDENSAAALVAKLRNKGNVR